MPASFSSRCRRRPLEDAIAEATAEPLELQVVSSKRERGGCQDMFMGIQAYHGG